MNDFFPRPDNRQGGDFLHGWYSYLIYQRYWEVTKEVLWILADNNLFRRLDKCEWEMGHWWDRDGSCKSCSHSRLANTDKPEGTPTVPWLRELLSNIDTLSQIYNITSRLHQLTGNVEWGWEGWTWCIQRLKSANYIRASTCISNRRWPYRVEAESSGFATGMPREMSAIMRASEEWRHYLQSAHRPVEIDTDNTNLGYFVTGKNWPSSNSLVPRTPMIALLWFMNRVRPWGRLTHCPWFRQRGGW